MLYKLVRPILFNFDAEFSHLLGTSGLKFLSTTGLIKCLAPNEPGKPVECLGLSFENCLGLAAGFDKNADHIDCLGQLGFGHVEVGTITPRPQVGNPKPRLFRLPKAQALINRMGFNNKGVDHLVRQLRSSNYQGVVGVNIGKNFDTPLSDAHKDYLICYKKVYEVADYIAVNVSSPNTEGLRSLQDKDALTEIVEPLLSERENLMKEYSKQVPLLVKLAPDLDEKQIEAVVAAIQPLQVDGLIATNTTINREAVSGLKHSEEKGGLSGTPLTARSVEVVAKFRELFGPEFPIIGVGGIGSAVDAQAMLAAGANLIQIYTALVYRGPEVIGEIVSGF